MTFFDAVGSFFRGAGEVAFGDASIFLLMFLIIGVLYWLNAVAAKREDSVVQKRMEKMGGDYDTKK